MLSPADRRAETSRMGRMRGAGLVATVVISAGLWLYGHGSSASSASASYCADVTAVVQTVTGTQDGGTGHPSRTRLAAMGTRLHTDATTLTRRGSAAAATAMDSLGTDVDQWRTAIVSSDAVGQTIALDRVLSIVTTIPGC